VAALLGNAIPEQGRRHATSGRRRHQRCLPGSAYASRFLLPGSP
jgi:hypothetical protein